MKTAPPPSHAVAADDDFTPDQLRAVLSRIAEYSGTLARLLRELQSGDIDDRLASSTLAAAEIVATTIGAMADTAAGLEIFGGHENWHVGPVFADMGKAGAA